MNPMLYLPYTWGRRCEVMESSFQLSLAFFYFLCILTQKETDSKHMTHFCAAAGAWFSILNPEPPPSWIRGITEDKATRLKSLLNRSNHPLHAGRTRCDLKTPPPNALGLSRVVTTDLNLEIKPRIQWSSVHSFQRKLTIDWMFVCPSGWWASLIHIRIRFSSDKCLKADSFGIFGPLRTTAPLMAMRKTHWMVFRRETGADWGSLQYVHQ